MRVMVAVSGSDESLDSSLNSPEATVGVPPLAWDFTEAELLDLADAKWNSDRMLRFVDVRLEHKYCQDLNERRRRLGLVMVAFWAFFCVLDFCIQGLWKRFAEDDARAWTTVCCRLLQILMLFVVLALVTSRVCSIEKPMCFLLYANPVLMMGVNTYRVSRLFDSDLAFRTSGGCGSDSCYDDSFMVLALLITSSVALLLSMRVVGSWISMPWSVLVYFLFSVTIGPQKGLVLLTCIVMYASLSGFLLVGLYRIECELRWRWSESLRLRVKMTLQRTQLNEQQTWLTELDERLVAMDSPAFERGAGEGTDGITPIAEKTSIVLVETDKIIVRTVPMPPGVRLDVCLERAVPFAEPNALLVARMAGRSTDTNRLRKMAERITEVSYGMHEFYEDALLTFPELELLLGHSRADGLYCDGQILGPVAGNALLDGISRHHEGPGALSQSVSCPCSLRGVRGRGSDQRPRHCSRLCTGILS